MSNDFEIIEKIERWAAWAEQKLAEKNKALEDDKKCPK